MDCSKELTETQLDDKCQFLADIEGICRLQLPNHLKHYGLQSISEHNGHLVPSVGEKIIIMSNVLTRAGNKGSRRFHIHGEGPASSSSVDRTQIKVHCTENTQV